MQQESSPDQNKFRVLSHLTSEESETDTETPATENVDVEQKKRKVSLKQCPCRSSSGGKAWLLVCTSCSQTWHNTCANLNGKLPKTTIDQIDGWQCPWCFVCPFAAPKNHRSCKNTSLLNETVIIDAINTTVEDTLNNSLKQQSDELLTTIQKDLDGLKTSLNEFTAGLQTQNEQQLSQGQENHVPPVIESLKEEIIPTDIPPFTTYDENFVSDEQASSLISFLSQEQFIKEGSREVKSYGERYHYKGAKSSETPIPNEIVPIIELIKEKNNIPYELNQILVNKYKDSSSFLPAHSDNEGSIRPESSIFTISLGGSGTIKFTGEKDESTELKVDPNSLYAMSRDSQNVFKHEVLPNDSGQPRYSITFRSVHWTFYNSTYMVGDSNFGKIKFGSEKGSLGAATPGQRDFAAQVKDIDPLKCASYRNIVVMSGTNDLKEENADIMGTYKALKGKIEQIRDTNPKGNIFVCQVLPSRDRALNRKINIFNKLLYDDLQQCNILKVNLVDGFPEFAAGGVLKDKLHDKRTPSDTLHINERGYCILVRLIKQAIFTIKRSKGRFTTGRKYSSVVRGTN